MGADSAQVTVAGGDPELVVRWDLERLRTRDEGGATPLWELDGELTPGSILRVLSASFEDGRMLLLAGVRPIDAEHDAERLGTLVIEADGESHEVSETLASTEYDDNGVPRRLGLEVYHGSELAPLRVAADREAVGDAVDGRSAVGLRLTAGGVGGRGLLETIAR